MAGNGVGGQRLSILMVSVGNIAGAAAQWYIVWLFARFAGPEAVGVYSSLIAVMSPIFITTQLGLRNLYITLQSVVSWRAYVCLRVVGIMTACSLTLGALLILAPGQAWSIGFAILVIKIANSTADLYLARIQRTERLRIFGLLLLLDALTTMAVTTAVMLISGSVLLALWAGAVVAVLGAVITVFLASAAPPEGRIARHPLIQDMRLLVVHGIPLAISQGIQSLLTYLPLAIVGSLGTTGEIGVFASAAYLVTFAHLVGASVQTAVLPDYRRRLESEGPAALRRVNLRNGYLTMAILAPLIVVAVVAGPSLLQLVYGADFEISRSAVFFLALATVICIPTYLLSSFHLVLNRYWVMTIVGAASALVVIVSGAASGLAGLGAVEAGTLAVLTAVACRYVGADIMARRHQVRASSLITGGGTGQ
ncbi:lipopolysaccharide biosynthesis protein [Nesterenkonia haasae]|uniref:lipopolysaccharide biosynthesis protein n=1 Tax=Nesterenkonia haasae TaxID=2587813 RepID=UPI001F19BFFC|nr:hypothetical protein [Nesterenkonia haasae]NDK33002.1 hypothetical protein [Nesterenkonia haasae]